MNGSELDAQHIIFGQINGYFLDMLMVVITRTTVDTASATTQRSRVVQKETMSQTNRRR